MADLEKVITGLECCSVKQSCSECPWKGINCNDRLHLAALELLKEQEAVKPTYEDFFGNRVARCGKCNGYIVRYKYCPGCGQAVKWDG